MTRTEQITQELHNLDGAFNQMVSVFGNALSNDNPKHQQLKDVLIDIQGGVYAEQVSKARNLLVIDRKQYDDYKKKHIDGFTLSAHCKHRKGNIQESEKLIKHTGILQIDFDFKAGITPEALQELKQKINADKHTLFSYVSISGIGLKAGILIDGNRHKESFIEAEKYYLDNYGFQIDKSVKDIFRLCFVSYDKDLFVNPSAELFGISEPEIKQDVPKLEQPKTPEVSINTNNLGKIKDNAIKNLLSYIGKATDGNRHRIRNNVSYLAGGYVAGGVLSEQEILSLIIQESDRISDTGSTPESELKTIRESFESGKSKPITKEMKKAEYENWCKNFSKKKSKPISVNKDTGEIKENEIEHRFWDETLGSKGEVLLKIDYVRLYDYFKSKGIQNIFIDDSGLKRVLVQINNNIVSEVDIPAIQKLIFNHIESLPEYISENKSKLDLHELLIKGIHVYLSTDKINYCLPCERIEFMKDTEHSGIVFFKNGFTIVTKDSIILKDYKDLPKPIWKRQIKEHNYETITNKDVINDFSFVKWTRNIVSTKNPVVIDKQRYISLLCTIGYLLHNYKTPANAYAVILSEANLDDTPKGRTGKGVLMQAIAEIRNVETEDGKNFDFKSRFAFQKVTLDTEIYVFNDVKKHFPFELLFHQITDSMVIEKKNKDKITLPVEKSPKIVISTNYAISGNAESDKGRKYDMELLPYYDSKHRPINDYGKAFFGKNWNETEWNIFFNFMLACLQGYLKNNCIIPEYSSATKDEKRLLNGTSQEFVEYADCLARNFSHPAHTIYKNYIDYAGLQEKDFTKNKMNKFFKEYAENRNLIFDVSFGIESGKTIRVYQLKKIN